MDLKERFWKKVRILGKDDCWEWQAGLLNGGYGFFKYGDKNIPASRMAWILTFGDPKKLLVLHSCDNPPCCNPNHLFLGTQQDNINDMIKKGRQVVVSGNKNGMVLHPESRPRGEKHPSSKLTDDDVRKIRKMIEDGFIQERIAEKFGVDRAIISNIKRGITRSWVE
jgi:hypothetical protein